MLRQVFLRKNMTQRPVRIVTRSRPPSEVMDEAAAQVERLRLTDAEREAIERAIAAQEHRAADMHPRSWIAADIDDDCDRLRALLERTR
jgi:hypothetical protein